MIGSRDIERIRETIVAASDGRHSLGFAFYGKLFDAMPEVRPMFSGDISVSVNKLMGMLQAVPMALEIPAALTEMLRELGANHLQYGVREEHYPPTAAVLMETLAEMCGDAWNDEAARAWSALLDLVCEEMIAGAREAAAQPAGTGCPVSTFPEAISPD